MGYNEDYDREDNTYYYSDERRNDPVLRDKVQKVVAAQSVAMAEAAELLKQAAQILNAHAQFVDCNVYSRNVTKIQIAKNLLVKDSEFMNRNGFANPNENDTYIGNQAAGPLGEQIQEMGDTFPL